MPLSFDHLVMLLRQPPFEPCRSEPRLLTNAEYEEAFNEVERLYRRPVIRYITRITGDPVGAEDLAQDVFNSVHRARVSLERAYIYRSAKNAALKELERTNRRRILESRWAGVRRYGDTGPRKVKKPKPSMEYLERTCEEAVRRAVSRLPEKFREALLLHAEGKSFEEIMERTGARSEEVVESRVCVAKSLLRRRLRDYLAGLIPARH